VNVRSSEEQERARNLIMAGLDDELSSEEQAELERLLAGDDRLRKEWERFKRVKEVTATMSYREPPEEVWGDHWTSVYNRMERGLGWLLVSAGALVLFGWVAWHWVHAILAESGLPGYIKVSIFAVVFGGAILLVSVIREKWFTRRSDPYKEVQR
jgi:ferric-dicitrate binding protein FerR (iron transport regulator)